MLSFHQTIAVGGEFARLWSELAEKTSLERDKFPDIADIAEIRAKKRGTLPHRCGGLVQISLAEIPINLRSLRRAREAVAEVGEEIDEITERYRTIPVTRPKGARAQTIKRVISWCWRRYQIEISARRVEVCVKAHRRIEAATRL